MAQLIVRNVEDDVKARLVERARRHGRSMEEEVRTILRNAVGDDLKTPPEIGLGSRLAAHFAEHGLDFELPEFGAEEARPARFD
ncbi:MAG: plasmid stabilization protein [Rhodomicrobiaceae bacterium]